MPVTSIGVDLAEIDRISEMVERYGERFVRRVFTATEIAYCQRKAVPSASYAARFAAKEAVLKATGVGLNLGMHWREVEVVNDAHGRPSVRLYGEAARRLAGKSLHLSLSHSHKMAVAMVVVDET